MTRCLCLLLLTMLIAWLPVCAAVPDPGERTRTRLALSEGWETATDLHGDAPRDAWARQLPDAAPVTFPTRWDDDATAGTASGAVWYACTVTLPEKTGETGVSLVFDEPVGVFDVYSDGTLLSHFFGNGLTRRVLLAGAPGSSHRVSLRLARAGLPAAIRRVVSCGLGAMSLELLPPVRLDSITPAFSLASDLLTIRYHVTAAAACHADLAISVLPVTGRGPGTHLKKPVPLELPAGDTDGAYTIATGALTRWSPDAPRLYRLSVDVGVTGSRERDGIQQIIAPCAVTFSTDHQLLVNGTRVTLRGLRLPGGAPPPSPEAVYGGNGQTGLHAELRNARKGGYAIALSDKLALTEELLEFSRAQHLTEMVLMRRAGYNAVLADGAALSDAVLRLADRLGMLVIAEIPPAREGDVPGEPEIAATLSALGHHPSIVAWTWQSSGQARDEVLALRTLDPIRPALVREPGRTRLFAASSADGEEIVALDEASFPDASGWLRAVQQAGPGEGALLITGTVAGAAPGPRFTDQLGELTRLTTVREAIESVLCARAPCGYFLRPARNGTLTGLVTPAGMPTQAYFAAAASNALCLLTLRVSLAEGQLRPKLVLVNERGATGRYRLHRLVTTPDGLTAAAWTDVDDPVSISASRRQEPAVRAHPDILGPIPTDAGPGQYRVQFILSLGSRVFAASQTVTVTVPASR